MVYQLVEQGHRPCESGEVLLVPHLVNVKVSWTPFPMEIPLPAGDLYQYLACLLGAL